MDKETMQQQFKKHRFAPESVEKNNNGSMAQNLDEMKKLGKEMNHMKTGSQQLEDGNLTPDPLQ
jgi:phage terminase large subunit